MKWQEIGENCIMRSFRNLQFLLKITLLRCPDKQVPGLSIYNAVKACLRSNLPSSLRTFFLPDVLNPLSFFLAFSICTMTGSLGYGWKKRPKIKERNCTFLYRQSWTANKGYFSSLGVLGGLTFLIRKQCVTKAANSRRIPCQDLSKPN